MNSSKKMMDNLTVRVPIDLLKEFETVLENDKTGNANKSNVVRSCVEAYIRLVKRANGRPLPALEFDGFDEHKNGSMQYFPTPRARQTLVAESRADYAAATGKIKK